MDLGRPPSLLLLLYIESEGLSVPESRASARSLSLSVCQTGSARAIHRSHFRDKRGELAEVGRPSC